ncbi:ABC transporter substrate-binding protein [Shewanella sp.]|uniref:ABC transporter substrate-binding protein n=1 Tax=Shewanella sp. TaxID=50422 RepID=UPI001ED4D526|nr:ABC transporter substrate-binding protein [Shewanella sp.]NRB23707.1 ABC transporter substrate-binding protein [Shewanella sp.]
MPASVRSPHRFITYLAFVITLFFVLAVSASAADKKVIKALYIPLADHYASIVAYERYRQEMKYADYQLEQMKNWDLLRAYFQSGEVDMAYVMSPLAMDMFSDKPHFRWIGLMHRDGNALAINDLLNEQVKLPAVRHERKPDDKVAKALKQVFESTGRATEIGMPHLLSTHTVVLYRYLKEHGLTMSLTPNSGSDVLAIAVAPPKSPSFIKSKSNRAQAAAFEQSLPWADVVETGGFGHVAWYSKDVMPWEHGHVECIALATDAAIKHKRQAVHEVMNYIHKAGEDIELARTQGGEALEEIVKLVRKHIPAHTREAIIASLDPDLRVINYQNLNVDKPGLKLIMDLAVEGGIISKAIDIEDFADENFSRHDLAAMSQAQVNR